MAPTERDGVFAVQLVGDTLRDPMTEEEEKMALADKFNPLSELSLNMQDQILRGQNLFQKREQDLFVVDMMGRILSKK